MNPLFLAIMDLCISLLCSYIAVSSDIILAAAIWGFSAGIWFNLAINYFHEWKLDIKR